MDTMKSVPEGAARHTCRDLLGIDCVLPLNHDGTHLSRHQRDVTAKEPHGEAQSVDVLTKADRNRAWRDRFGRRVWWHEVANRWVSQVGTGEPLSIEDLDVRGPFTVAA